MSDRSCPALLQDQARTEPGACAPLGIAVAQGGLQVHQVVTHIQALLLHLLRLVHHRLQVALQLGRMALQCRQLSIARRDRHSHSLVDSICTPLHAQQLQGIPAVRDARDGLDLSRCSKPSEIPGILIAEALLLSRQVRLYA